MWIIFLSMNRTYVRKVVFSVCVSCGKNKKIYCKGMCDTCYDRQLVPSRWSEKSDFCVKCGSSESPHVAHGLCRRCYGQQETNILCACGCGLTVPRRGNEIKKYRKGHWLRAQGKESEFQKSRTEKLSGKGNPQYGKFGKDHPAYGHKTKPEVREQRRQRAIKRVASRKTSKTDIEIILSDILDEMGIEHISQHPLKNKFVVDEFLPKYGIVIEANGDYWHGNTLKFPVLNKVQKKNSDRDAGRFIYLHKCGYTVVFFWGHELIGHREYCKRRILELTKYTLLPNIQDSVQ